MNFSLGVTVLLLPVAFGLAVGLHTLLARATKGVLSSIDPLSEGEPPIGGYERQVLSTAHPTIGPVLASLAAAGAIAWLALVTPLGVMWGLLPLALAAALWFDLKAWERVAVSATRVWHQPGWGAAKASWPIADIEDLRIEETDTGGFTLRHGRANRVARLWLRLRGRQLVGLAFTDAVTADEAVESAANRIRERIAQGLSAEALAQSEAAARRAARAAAEAAAHEDPQRREERLALQRLRQKALAPDDPVRPAAPPPRA